MKNLTYGALKKMVQEAILEANCTSQGGATLKSGEGMNYATPKAFKSGAPFKTVVKRPKRPSHTKMFDFLEENK